MQNRINAYLEEVAKRKRRRISVSLFGYGSTNKAVFQAIKDNPVCDIITERQTAMRTTALPSSIVQIPIERALDLSEDIVFASPSFRRDEANWSRKTVITSDTEIFFESANKKLFTVSGSDGKSTVTTLTSLMLAPSFHDIFVGGNLGCPLASASMESDAFVLELSSFNLLYSAPRYGRGALTSVSPNHLDWHASLAEYYDCKLRLIDSVDEAVCSLDCDLLHQAAKDRRFFALVSDTHSHADIKSGFKTEHTVTYENRAILVDGKRILSSDGLKRRERYNIQNVMLAIAMSLGYASKERISEVAGSFDGLSNRCEIINIRGTDYVNSSIDTTPHRTKTTLTGLDRKVRIILGGKGKGLSYEPLLEPLAKYAERIALYGSAAEEIVQMIRETPDLANIPYECFGKLCDAIDYAADGAAFGDTVLLSPAATSYGEFDSFEQRGKYFKDYIKNISKI